MQFKSKLDYLRPWSLNRVFNARFNTGGVLLNQMLRGEVFLNYGIGKLQPRGTLSLQYSI